MINKKLIKIVPDAMGHIKRNVISQIIGLFSNIILMLTISLFLSRIISNSIVINEFFSFIGTMLICIIIKVTMVYIASKNSYLASKSVKSVLRTMIYDKVVRLKSKYTNKVSSAQLLQMSIEGVEQLETYFSNFLPQFFYSMISPFILFIVVSFINLKVAIILFICVPMIPISIVVVQKFAKKLLAKYWGEYLGLADNFLENLQGLNTLKIYSADEYKHIQMNKQAERFRVVTMKVLSMQLNSIIVMDIVAYGGAALGIIFALMEFSAGTITTFGMFSIMFLSADFFLPLRILGSFFHIAMNGIAASKKIFTLLEMQENEEKTNSVHGSTIQLNDVSFSYEDKKVLDKIQMEVNENEFVSIVGKSGCGKSTIASILMGINEGYQGNITIGNQELNQISSKNLLNKATLVSANSYIFKGTVKENLLMANKTATDEMLWSVLDSVNLKEFLQTENGLDTKLMEKGSNFSGGQCQRLAIARALLHDSEIYIFDEATSNIDAESENDIMDLIHGLVRKKTVILISHRLANVVKSDKIYVLKDGFIIEEGKHESLIALNGYYYELYNTQVSLENVKEQDNEK